MKQLLSERTAATLVALSTDEVGLRLAEIARLTGAPLSSAQRTVESLLDQGLVVRIGETRPRYRLAPEVPRDALAQLAAWRLTPPRADSISQQVRAMEGDADLPPLDLRQRVETAMADPSTAVALRDLAERLIWWQPAEQSLRHPARLIAQAMAIGTTQDAALAQAVFDVEALRAVLGHAPPGVFSPRRWDFWHLHFGYRQTPPLPIRHL